LTPACAWQDSPEWQDCNSSLAVLTVLTSYRSLVPIDAHGQPVSTSATAATHSGRGGSGGTGGGGGGDCEEAAVMRSALLSAGLLPALAALLQPVRAAQEEHGGGGGGGAVCGGGGDDHVGLAAAREHH
jgi:hypothetical protein